MIELLLHILLLAILFLLIFELFSRIDIFILKRQYQAQKARLKVIMDSLIELRVGLLTGDYPEYINDIATEIINQENKNEESNT